MTYISHPHEGATGFETELGLMPLERRGVPDGDQLSDRLDRAERIILLLLRAQLGTNFHTPANEIRDPAMRLLQDGLDAFRTPDERGARMMMSQAYPDSNDHYSDEHRTQAVTRLAELSQPQ